MFRQLRMIGVITPIRWLKDIVKYVNKKYIKNIEKYRTILKW